MVFSEMQAIENESRSVAYLAMRKQLYPGGTCGFSMETGGIMSQIRTLTVEQVRQYHKEYYRPDNTFVIVAGKVGAGEVLSSVDKLQPKMSDPSRHPPPASLPKPFTVHQVPPLMQSADQLVEFPADDLESG